MNPTRGDLALVADAVREREDDGTDASARLLQHWVRAVTRDRVLRGTVAWPRTKRREHERNVG